MIRQFLLLSFVFPLAFLRANVVPAPVFQEHAVLQQGQPVPVWGTGDPGEKVTVTFAGQTVSSVTGADRRWSVQLKPLATNASPAQLVMAGKNTVTLQDILVGEVWLASGQSNMALKVAEAAHAAEETAAANYPLLREFNAPNVPANTPQTTIRGNWMVCSPETVGRFTAVGYFFARDLQKELGVPVGIIHSSWGGTFIEAWMPAETLAGPPFQFVADQWQKRLDDYPAALAKYQTRLDEAARKAADAQARGETFKKPWIPAPPNPDGTAHMDKPSNIYNGMIAPFVPTALAGVIWYQGENNVGRATQYRQLFPALIQSWRKVFARPNLPFYWVQLPNFSGFGPEQISALREAQASALVLPQTGQAVTIDVGESASIHPKNKQDVGHRLALIALQKTYGRDVADSGPVLAAAAFKKDVAEVSFTEIAKGLAVKGDTLMGFELAGADRKFLPAEATISGKIVTVHAAAVPSPVAVRYAFHNDPHCSLTNSTGLPAAPFRSDDWPLEK